MCKLVGAFFFLGLAAVLSIPIKDAFILEDGKDTATVESTVREARQAPEHIEDLLKPGYNHFDSFHKKDADKYGYEVHREFGKSDKAKVDTPDKNGKYKDEEKDDGQESRTLYRVSGESKGDKEGKSFLDDFDFVYFGDGGGAAKYVNGGSKGSSNGGKSQSYESGGSYSKGSSHSYDSGDKKGSSSNDKSQSLKADDDGDHGSYYGEEEENEEEEY
ncbi:hypothetical protein NQ315_011595 [Exocentrus adspersus]|uniref:Uncharacterized protein n=1 Tax=Exocentrus adspersus TaxID=1586481 RepID=A0AAV8VV85_9CUCU|nr:hypothetical protein NQ315_011595 [Exocentrus adspersus]